MDETRALRRAVQARTGRRFAPEVRERLQRYVQRRRVEGIAARVIAEDLGIAYETVLRWTRETPSSPIRPVEILAARAHTGTPVLVTPAGHRVEGLSIDEIATVLRALG